MRDDRPPEAIPLSDAQSLFSEYLRRLGDGETIAFEEFCAAHREHETALKILQTVYEEGLSAVDVNSPTLQWYFGAGTSRPGDGGVPSTELAEGDLETTDAGSLLGKTDHRRYQNRGEIARGGMGVILRVWDRDLQREIAMKVIRRGEVSGAVGAAASPVPARELARFFDEAQVTAQLDHPGIVPVYELGVESHGHPYFTMPLVKGRALKEIFALARAEEEEWNLPRAVGVIIKACQAIAYAHSKGVLHRDLKLANVMVGRFGEVYVMDWGLAKVTEKGDLHAVTPQLSGPVSTLTTVQSYRREKAAADPESPLVTLEGAIAGTPAFMSPEAANGRVQDVDFQSDVYSLGAILYCLLTGQIPYVTEQATPTARTILAQVQAGPPRPVAECDPSCPSELVAICDKAMARSKADRYSSAMAMAEDLQAFLDGRVVSAYKTGAIAELKKWMSRNRGTAAAMAAAAVFLLAGLVGVSWALIEAEESRAVAVQERDRANAERDRVLRLSDVKKLRDSIDEAETLWPCLPANVPKMREWIANAEELVARLPDHRESLVELEKKVLLGDDATVADHWHHDTLAELVAGVEALDDPDPFRGALASVRKRVEWAEILYQKTIEERREDWNVAIAAVADPERSPRYAGQVRLRRQIGLVPIGQDPESGLWEFSHLQTGEEPRRDAAGQLVITEETGLVFVFVPGGTFRMGTRPPTESLTEGPNVDPYSAADERPCHDVSLRAFLISKYEMTQGQWKRFTGKNPSRYSPDAAGAGEIFSLRHPVESVSRDRCEIVLARLGLQLPTEAQWEYAARGGTTSVWWTGDDRRSVHGAGNLRDESLRDSVKPPYEPELVDGYRFHAPVGSFAANGFGLHDVIGNVWEWVDGDYSHSYDATESSRAAATGGRKAVIRGGSFVNLAPSARPARRYPYGRTNTDNDVGVRPVFILQGD